MYTVSIRDQRLGEGERCDGWVIIHFLGEISPNQVLVVKFFRGTEPSNGICGNPWLSARATTWDRTSGQHWTARDKNFFMEYGLDKRRRAAEGDWWVPPLFISFPLHKIAHLRISCDVMMLTPFFNAYLQIFVIPWHDSGTAFPFRADREDLLGTIT